VLLFDERFDLRLRQGFLCGIAVEYGAPVFFRLTEDWWVEASRESRRTRHSRRRGFILLQFCPACGAIDRRGGGAPGNMKAGYGFDEEVRHRVKRLSIMSPLELQPRRIS
jgi:hypothetical protein